jgi:hypothetical protein
MRGEMRRGGGGEEERGERREGHISISGAPGRAGPRWLSPAPSCAQPGPAWSAERRRVMYGLCMDRGERDERDGNDEEKTWTYV